MPLGEACDQVVELDDVWGPEGGLLRERLCEAATPAAKFRVLEAVLIEHIARSADPAVAYIPSWRAARRLPRQVRAWACFLRLSCDAFASRSALPRSS